MVVVVAVVVVAVMIVVAVAVMVVVVVMVLTVMVVVDVVVSVFVTVVVVVVVVVKHSFLTYTVAHATAPQRIETSGVDRVLLRLLAGRCGPHPSKRWLCQGSQ